MSYKCKNFFLLKNNPWCLKMASSYYILKNYLLINVKISLSRKDLISFNSLQILQILLSSALDFFFMALDFMFYVHQSLCWCNGFGLLLFSSNYFLVFYLLVKVYLGTFTFFFFFQFAFSELFKLYCLVGDDGNRKPSEPITLHRSCEDLHAVSGPSLRGEVKKNCVGRGGTAEFILIILSCYNNNSFVITELIIPCQPWTKDLQWLVRLMGQLS